MTTSFFIPDENDNFKSLFENNFNAETKEREFYDSNIDFGGGGPNLEDTKLDQRRDLFNIYSSTWKINSPEIILVNKINITTEEIKSVFNPSIQAQIEENSQVINPTPLPVGESPNQGSSDPSNLSQIRNGESPIQPSTESNNLTPISNEGSSNQSSSDSDVVRIDDLHMEIFCDPMVYFKLLVKRRYNINIDSFDCGKVLKKNTGEKKKILKKTNREILSKDEEILKRIIKFISKCDEVKKKELNYFLGMTYEELFWHYINNNKDFHISIGASRKIKEFITLKEAIPLKIKKLEKRRKYKNNKALLQYKIDLYKKRAKNIIEKIKLGQMERGKKTIKIFKISKKTKRKKKDA